MLRLLSIFAVIGISLLLTSCYTISKKECLAGDWKGIGFTDGFNGYQPQARFEGHIKSCKRVKVVPNLTLWNQGYKKGLLRYCTASSGLWEGQHGYGYNGLCPPKTEAEFLRGHELGYRQYSLEAELERLKDEANDKEEELEDLSEKLKTVPEAQKYEIRSDIRDLEWELTKIRDKQRDVESDLYLAEGAVARFRSQL
ncbi:hypothetical protein FHS26_001180 [Rhizobium pisi]|uniref:DUF2799 domain-containing protein n=1 Tax=Rhizobium pisi TaxID=574561 RepID=A0A427N5Q4_9HYPH|nr:DUF2799 domain-containing protein [Rhizobium pisi]MBB3133476.1 hypothetical protein [Rhizobium pisi]RSB82130.1 DUF2799 domain-containing protein [Rhizobium pisi]TCA57603.1 DUF2799 domain-containing protein [Rhizobium pisi]